MKEKKQTVKEFNIFKSSRNVPLTQSNAVDEVQPVIQSNIVAAGGASLLSSFNPNPIADNNNNRESQNYLLNNFYKDDNHQEFTSNVHQSLYTQLNFTQQNTEDNHFLNENAFIGNWQFKQNLT